MKTKTAFFLFTIILLLAFSARTFASDEKTDSKKSLFSSVFSQIFAFREKISLYIFKNKTNDKNINTTEIPAPSDKNNSRNDIPRPEGGFVSSATTPNRSSSAIVDDLAASRNSRRIADLKNFQVSLELYFDDNETYPSSLSVLAPKYTHKVSTDPSGIQYFYKAMPDGCGEQNGYKCLSYHIGANLELESGEKRYLSSDTDEDSSVFKGGIKGADNGPCYTANFTGYCYDLTPGTIKNLPKYPLLTAEQKNRNYSSVSSLLSSESIKVIFPNGGETLEIGKTYELKWSSEGLAPDKLVTISIYSNGTGKRIYLARNIANDGIEKWAVPSSFKPGISYILIIEASGSDCKTVADCVSNASDENFKISNPLLSDSVVIKTNEQLRPAKILSGTFMPLANIIIDPQNNNATLDYIMVKGNNPIGGNIFENIVVIAKPSAGVAFINENKVIANAKLEPVNFKSFLSINCVNGFCYKLPSFSKPVVLEIAGMTKSDFKSYEGQSFSLSVIDVGVTLDKGTPSLRAEFPIAGVKHEISNSTKISGVTYYISGISGTIYIKNNSVDDVNLKNIFLLSSMWSGTNKPVLVNKDNSLSYACEEPAGKMVKCGFKDSLLVKKDGEVRLKLKEQKSEPISVSSYDIDVYGIESGYKIFPAAITSQAEISFPAGGESLEKGKNYQILWKKSPPTSKVAINAFNRTTGKNYLIADLAYPLQKESFDWKIPFDIPEGQYYVNLNFFEDDSMKGDQAVKSPIFNIFPATQFKSSSEPEVIVLSPNGGEIFNRPGFIYPIKWSTNRDDLKATIILLDEKDNIIEEIARDLPNNGNYNWAVPSSIFSSYSQERHYKIKIAINQNGVILASDTSDKYFIARYESGGYGLNQPYKQIAATF